MRIPYKNISISLPVTMIDWINENVPNGQRSDFFQSLVAPVMRAHGNESAHARYADVRRIVAETSRTR